MSAFELRWLPVEGAQSLCWRGDHLVDWVRGGWVYHLDGSCQETTRRYKGAFDAAVNSPSGRFAVVYERLGVHGLVLDGNGAVIRELVRGNAQDPDVYEYPVTLFVLPDGTECLAHCPDEYWEIAIEETATGRRLTPSPEYQGMDFFHSRLAVDPSSRFLLSAGWVWHPIEAVAVFELVRSGPGKLYLAERTGEMNLLWQLTREVSSAAFSTAGQVIVATHPDGQQRAPNLNDPNTVAELSEGQADQLACYDCATCQHLSTASVRESVGTIMAVGQRHVVSFLDHPKLIDLTTGRITQRWSDLDTGEQNGSIIVGLPHLPPLALDPVRRRFAVAREHDIAVVTLPDGL